MRKSEQIDALNKWIDTQNCSWLKATFAIHHVPITYKINLKKVVNNTFNMANQYIFGKRFKSKTNHRQIRNIATQAGSASNFTHQHFHCLIEMVDFTDKDTIHGIFQKSFNVYANRELKNARFKYKPDVWMEDYIGTTVPYITYIIRNENDNFGFGIDKVDLDITHLSEG